MVKGKISFKYWYKGGTQKWIGLLRIIHDTRGNIWTDTECFFGWSMKHITLGKNDTQKEGKKKGVDMCCWNRVFFLCVCFCFFLKSDELRKVGWCPVKEWRGFHQWVLNRIYIRFECFRKINWQGVLSLKQKSVLLAFTGSLLIFSFLTFPGSPPMFWLYFPFLCSLVLTLLSLLGHDSNSPQTPSCFSELLFLLIE